MCDQENLSNQVSSQLFLKFPVRKVFCHWAATLTRAKKSKILRFFFEGAVKGLGVVRGPKK